MKERPRRRRRLATCAPGLLAALLLLALALLGALASRLQEGEARLRSMAAQLQSQGGLAGRAQLEPCNGTAEAAAAAAAAAAAEGSGLGLPGAYLYSQSLVLRAYLQRHAARLEGAWRARGAGQMRRGVVVAAGREQTLGNAFAALHVLRHHLQSGLPFAIM